MILIVARHQVRPECAGDFPRLVAEFTAATRAEPGTISFEWSRSTDDPAVYRAWNGHGDFDNRDTARNHGINNCAALRNALRTENRNETDAFDDLLGCFSHGFLELHKNYRAMRAEPPWMTRSTSASVAMLVSPGVVMASAP